MMRSRTINQLIIQLYLNGGPLNRQLWVKVGNQKQTLDTVYRTFVQSASCQQKVTNANNQQLISVARNISFRQCQQLDRSASTSASKSFSMAASPTAQFISSNLSSSILIEHDEQEATIDAWARKVKDTVSRKDGKEVNKYYGQSFNINESVVSDRRLVVLLSWLEAQEKHIEKYRQFYLARGFDVLNVKTSPMDLLLPQNGALKIAKDFVRFMIEKDYSNVLLHGFSVGGFMFGQILLELDKLDEETRKKSLQSIRGIVFDSLVPFEGTCIGVANSITRNKVAAKVIERLLELYLVLGRNIATKYYEAASKKVWGVPLKTTPTLFLMSRDDPISDHRIIQCLEGVWRRGGVETHTRLFDNSPHVQLYMKHQQDYVNSVEKFLRGINLM